MHEQRVQQETEELRRRNQSRERVLTRLWEIANMDPERTRNSMSAQIKAISTIVAIEDLIPARHSARRTVSAQNVPAPPPVHPQIQPSPDRYEDGPGAVADAPSDLGRAPDPTLVNPTERPRRRLMPPCPLLLQTNGFLPPQQRNPIPGACDSKGNACAVCAQKARKDRILSNFIKIEDTRNLTKPLRDSPSQTCSIAKPRRRDEQSATVRNLRRRTQPR
jgi:hypothetical protein